MNANTITNPVKIAIVGMTGSGKTVLVTTLAVKMAQITLKDIYMGPFGENRRQTLKYTQDNWQTLANGQWPPSTPAGELIQLQWELNTKNCQATVQFLDCAGQDIRSLFRTEYFNPSSLGGDLRKVYDSVNSANVLILLVNMKDLLASSNMTDEILDLDQMLQTLQQRKDIPRRVAVAFSQYDKYKPEVNQKFKGDFLEYVRHYIPHLYGQYQRFHKFEIIPVAAVNDTREVIENGVVKQYPAPDFTSYNLETLIQWIADSVEDVAVEIAKKLEEERKRLEEERKRKEENDARYWRERQRQKEEEERKQSEEENKRKQRRSVLVSIFILILICFGVYNLNQPKKGSFEWYRQRAEQGDANAQYQLGYFYYNGNGVSQDYAEAVKWYRKAAEQGNANAQYNLGDCYEKGVGVEQDMTEAVMWYRKAAEQGDSNAQNYLGWCYEHGKGVEKDYDEALIWYCKAAEQGNAFAQNNLGSCYEYGKGVNKDYEEAVKWYYTSANQGNVWAQNNLGLCYEYGKGVKKNMDEAIEWYRKAAEQGNEHSINALKRLNVEL